MNKFEKICKDIKSVKIQGATNVAKAAIRAYLLKPTHSSKKKLISLRPTEPTLVNSLNFLKKWSRKSILSHFDEAQDRINSLVYKVLKNKKIIYTHCHSTNVVKALIYSKKKGRKFSVSLTETRPLYQGRKTAMELANARIKATLYADSAMHDAIEKADLILLGADAILNSGVINKIGSEAISDIAKTHNIPLHIIADSWKFSPKNVKIEERDFHEVWRKAPKNIKIRNPAFEKIPKKNIKSIISELGNLKYSGFIKKADKII
ncbi:hypothetical protein COU62_03770 [Candidatus Pacearchaeota archaeon CG10_big_fil_rev_8_21_14_0_10_35_219]|uniref:R15P Isomerase n=1 Tax=uncultured Candidatus Pacearchaeota archaeon TaxID=2109283 RepID=A0A447IU51_9ARCH|nr:hypothetical protein [Candidatus Pacearchaeota archaeon]OIO42297.1 MAG: hypothetical protein AUJ63_03400 [Candidatus Pacearchaeota archaeon CG1_02_35_32]PIO07469.1 MAG: hypothetical protein COU62_03770 [Candidatus Pacearchaeota archaeon CG10_big_fil_rev_8_21_14_0_10_35_219]PIY81275.1 MAG: hypothetical protein COY79_03265 [Candidatus Pacearchaeota archaeon CG_4_10_14_0_8_um_filter_35_169]PIZ80204.1 MAG: hypothetical protein COY00_01910 [Candidatus Pacearchaeota archaeon CG_4_10_14_0_2_um_filt